MIGLNEGKVRTISLRQREELADWEFRRPTEQWWMELRPIIDVLAAGWPPYPPSLSHRTARLGPVPKGSPRGPGRL